VSRQEKPDQRAAVWVRMQGAYDTWHAEREEDVSKIPTLRARAA
jgi:antitoxin HigA-1